MGFTCVFRHQFGLPRLDANGIAWNYCMRCGRAFRSPAKIGPDSQQSASLTARREQAIAMLGEKWVGKPTNESNRPGGPLPKRPQSPEKPALQVVPSPTVEDALDEGGRAA